MRGKVETRVGIFVLAALAVFAYMGFRIGAFRFDMARYSSYSMYFKDLAGLARKADVKIAGVKVGWVDEIKLIPDDEMRAEARVMILKDYALYSDAYAMVRQDGLLGPRYIEIIPGDPMLRELEPGSQLVRPSTEPVSVDELLLQFKKIATNVLDVSESVRDVIGGEAGKEQVKSMFENLQLTAQRFSNFADVIERTIVRNEDSLDSFFDMGNSIQRLSHKLEMDVLPSFQESVEKISTVFDRDFSRVAAKIESTADVLEDMSSQARDGLRSVSSVAEKIDEGKGLLGKLVNDDETYRDLRVAVQGFKNYLTKLDRLQVVFDTHFETMQRPAENYRNEDSKGYFDMRIYPSQDHFYLIQVATSEKGFVDRKLMDRTYLDEKGQPVDVQDVGEPMYRFHPRNIFQERIEKYKRNTYKLGIQFGKIYHDVAFRFGLFEGTAGAAIDIDIPFRTDKFRWVTTLEAFDMRGWNRKDDRRVHLKWLNRMFILRNIYLTFGADDFVSKHNANPFFGAGMRFGDDDVKYFLSSLSGVACGLND